MSVYERADETDGSAPRQTNVEKTPAAAKPLMPQFVKTEANLLRLPLFALHTKRLKTLDGIECRGRMNRDGQKYQFVFRATRNAATLYPGPLARSAHLAFLSIVTEQGLPIQNPLTWTWRDLCRRMGIVYGGQIVAHLKAAITATTGLLIFSDYALYSKVDGKPIQNHQDALHLYERAVFCGSTLPDGTEADTNYLWLSNWYVQNLNTLFAAPLDYQLWRRLETQSPIASRLYEFLLLNFYSGLPVFRINYETLTQFLPVRPERFLSQAKRQLDHPFTLLQDVGILADAVWQPTPRSLGQLHLYRGVALPLARDPVPTLAGTGEFEDGVRVRELRNLRLPEWQLVTQFYRLWSGVENYRPTKKELEQATALIAEHGPGKAAALIPLAVEHLKLSWPDAKAFGAIMRLLPHVAADYDRKRRRQELDRADQAREKQEAESRAAERETLERVYRPIWAGLPEPDRQIIRAAVLEKNPHLGKTPATFERLCLVELSRRQPSAEPVA